MLKGKTVAVVVPGFNEEKQIGMVIETMPDFVDRIVVVNDGSTDGTADVVKKLIKKDTKKTDILLPPKVQPTKYNRAELAIEKLWESQTREYPKQEIYNKNPQEGRIILINHLENVTGMTVGNAIKSGYRWCREYGIDCTAVMAADGQMDPDELRAICIPIIRGEVDYVKGNRLKHRSAFQIIPRVRFFGNSVLSLLTKIASGYWYISDTQTGYTAMSFEALSGINIHKIYHSYGCPNDILVKLNISSFSIKEVSIKPIYEIGEKSKMKIFKVIPRISLLLFKSFWKRLYIKYLFRDFHPLFLLYHLSFLIIICNIPFTFQVIRSLSPTQTLPLQTLIIFVFLTISGLQSLFFAMWMDMIDNARLQQ